ncbi:efflux transporter, outer membrane factor (OMF) lipoprotein, NodT family [Sinomicrobium oceani]|uniref:Efflux transporter, outer membrane factor (OMF) lipoprotein, NodT family n=1 Tax=Sinomicrobium oceani TaxID=1150368 RepID=A0A1K1RGV0_9FLAO|nr:efflux transporter outer membrane subunit [Sinomicrobium oceani]SFW71288.1 efflux transporter, outer membrane factor (OMF) lipoprotein, NodT family [Sinomicrobium oceani]
MNSKTIVNNPGKKLPFTGRKGQKNGPEPVTGRLSRLVSKTSLAGILVLITLYSCAPTLETVQEDTTVPEQYAGEPKDSLNTARINWKEYFTDPYLDTLISEALENNQELNITLQELEIARNEIRARKGEYLPFIGLRGGAAVDKKARYTSQGASEATTDIKPGKEMPEPLQDYLVGAYASWEIDIWGKLHNAKKAAVSRYLSTVEGKNFVITNLIAEIANSYYELLALDNQLHIVQQNIDIQTNALRIVKLQKEAARVNELAVRKFEAEVYHTKSLQFDIQQKITETENRINFLAGRYPQHIARDSDAFSTLIPDQVHSGLPSQLLENRPDIKQAELELVAAKLDIKTAKARFYPSLGISAGIGYQAFNPKYLLRTPESLLYSVAGDLTAPLINRNEIKATYYSANAKQIQAVYNYERTILNAYIEVANQLAKIGNLEKSYDLKSKEVDALIQSIDISNILFRSARADYMEVLLTQRDALESRFELVETKMQQMSAMVNIYRALGGGWN